MPRCRPTLPAAQGSWDEVWGVAVALYIVGTVVWNLFATGERVID